VSSHGPEPSPRHSGFQTQTASLCSCIQHHEDLHCCADPELCEDGLYFCGDEQRRAGVVASTASEIVRFFDALFGGQLLSRQFLQEMKELIPVGPHVISIGASPATDRVLGLPSSKRVEASRGSGDLRTAHRRTNDRGSRETSAAISSWSDIV
jgi:hypothetical protein